MSDCPHPSFAIVIDPDSEDLEEPQFSLHCHECREELPFFFYTKGMWDQMGKVDDGT
jgi:hypothetical protein